jgi:hypothetical protein
MMDSEVRKNCIQAGVRERKSFRVSEFKGHPTVLAPRDPKHCG